MKLNISSDAEHAIQEITTRIRKINPYANLSASAITARILTDFAENATRGALERVTEALMSSAMKRKVLLEKLTDLAKQDEDVAIRVLERGFRKLDRLRRKPEVEATVSESQT